MESVAEFEEDVQAVDSAEGMARVDAPPTRSSS